jgi:hypothetical protein
MAASSCPVRRVLLTAAIFSLAGLAAGCGGGEEGVRSYSVPKSSDKSEKGGPAVAAAGGEYRILGAAYPAENAVWYFKFTGTAADVAKYEADFDKMAASVKLQGDAVPTFTLPEGWTLGGPREVSRGGVTVRFEQTIRAGDSEITVSRADGGLVANVSRWAKQVGDLNVRDPVRATREFQADGVKGVRVDVKGPLNPFPPGARPTGNSPR